MSELREQLLSSVLLLALKRLADRDCLYDGPNIIIRCASHADALRTMFQARQALGKAEAAEREVLTNRDGG